MSFNCNFFYFSVGDTLGYPVWSGYFGLSYLVRDTLIYPIWSGYFGLSCLVRILWFIRFVACLCLLMLEDVLPLAVECLLQQLFISFSLFIVY